MMCALQNALAEGDVLLAGWKEPEKGRRYCQKQPPATSLVVG